LSNKSDGFQSWWTLHPAFDSKTEHAFEAEGKGSRRNGGSEYFAEISADLGKNAEDVLGGESKNRVDLALMRIILKT